MSFQKPGSSRVEGSLPDGIGGCWLSPGLAASMREMFDGTNSERTKDAADRFGCDLHTVKVQLAGKKGC